MNKGLTYIVSGAVGAAIGASVAWIFAKKKYEKIAVDEINTMQEYFNQQAKNLADMNSSLKEDYFNSQNSEPEPCTPVDFDDVKHENIFERKNEYMNAFEERYNSIDLSNEEEDEEMGVVDDEIEELEEYPKVSNPPVQIGIDEYGDQEDFDLISLYYYAKDKVLTDDADEIIDDPNATVGLDNLKYLDNGEDDRLYVRNYQRHCDYEILLDEKGYAETHN